MKFHKSIWILSLVLFLLGCNSEKRYVENALDIMEEHSINTETIDWDKVRMDAHKQVQTAKTTSDSHAIIRETLRYLRDGHSFLMTEGAYNAMQTVEKSLPEIESENINNEIGYIKVPAFLGTPKMAKNYALELQSHIRQLDRANLKGWIVDLSENSGGNMWPMLLGLAPILEEGTCGFFTDNKENYNPWRCNNGKVFIGNNTIMEIENPYLIKNMDKKVAVIIGKATASSGEATAVSFIGKEDTRFFGVETAGLTTGNAAFELKDGARLFLTTTIFVDRNKKKYGATIKPDYATFQARKKAIEWINE